MKKMLKKSGLLLLMLILVVALTACGGETKSTTSGSTGDNAPTGEPINVGGLFNITGGQSSLDDPASKGFKLAADQINAAGGINGRPVNVVIYDGKTDQTTCANNTKKMIDVDKVVAIGGLSDSNYALAGGGVAQQAGVPFVFSGATTPDLPEKIGNFAFLTAFGDDACGYAAAEYLYKDLGITKCYMLIDQSMEFTKALAKFFEERYVELGGEIVLKDNYMNKDPDYSAQIDRYLADNKGAEAVFVSGVPDDAGVITKQFRDKGVKELLISGDGWDTPLLMEVAGEAAEGVIISTHCSFENQDPIVQNFVKDYKEVTGVDPENAFAALGYDCMNVIAEAIKMCGDDVTPANIRDNLDKIDGFKAVTGTISYKNGPVPDKSATINKVEGGKFVFLKEISDL